MGYDETLATKIHSLLSAIGPCERSGLLGNVTFTVNGNVAAGVEDSSVFLRVGDAHAAELLKIQGVKPWPITGRPTRGWVLLTPIAIGPTIVMRERLGWAYQVAGALPAKAVPKSALPPRPPPPPPPPPEPKKAPARAPARPKQPKHTQVPAATTVIAPGMERPLSPPTRIPYVPTVSKTVTSLGSTRPQVGVVPRPMPSERPSKPGKPIARPAALARPATTAPAAPSRPTAASPTAAKPMAAKPAAAKPIAAKPIAAKPIAAKPIAAKPIAAKPAAKKAAAKPAPKPAKSAAKGKAPARKVTAKAAAKPAARPAKQGRAASKPAKSASRQVRGRPAPKGRKPAGKKTGKAKKR